jgi:tRNA A37 threonylcarbamoyladenosine dehydratase
MSRLALTWHHSFSIFDWLDMILQVSLSSLNRHAVATRADVGISKAVCLQSHFQRIFPECEVEARNQMFDASVQDELLSGSPDYVLDCIDNIDTKVLALPSVKISQEKHFFFKT